MINAFKTAMLLTALSVLLLIVGQSLGGDNGLVIALVFAIAVTSVRTGFRTKLYCGCIGRRKLGRS